MEKLYILHKNTIFRYKYRGKIVMLLLFFFFIYNFLIASPLESFNKGLLAYNEKNYMKAIEFFLNSISENPNYYDAIFYLGLSYYNLKNFNLSLEYFLKAEKLVSTDHLLLYYIALTYSNTGNFEKAFSYINKIKKLKPTFLDVYYLEADIYYKQGYLPQALNIYNNILKDYPNDWKTYLLLYKFYYNTGSKNFAVNFLQKAINLAPYEEEIYEELINFFWEKADYQNAYFYLQTLYKINPENEIAMEYEGKLAKFNGNLQRSIEIFEYLIKKDPQNLDYIWPLIDLYINNKLFDKAIDVIQQSLNVYKGDELLSNVLREILIDNRELNINLRKEISKDVFKWGQYFYRSGYVNQGEFFIKVATLLEPSNLDYRNFYLNILKTKNLIFEQLEQYILLEAFGIQTFQKNKEILQKYIKNMIESKYNLSPDSEVFTKTKINLGIFLYIKDDIKYDEFQLTYLQKYIYDIIKLYAKNFNIIFVNGKFNSLESLSKYALQNKIELGMIFEVYNLIEDVDINFKIINTSNLQTMFSKRIYYKSEFALLDNIYYFYTLINELIPLRAEIIKVEGNEAIINVGYENGIKKGDKVIILNNKELKLKDKEFSFLYDNNNIQANGEIIEVSQKASRIKFEKTGIYSKILNGYFVVIKKQ
ncbi:MAG: tetratricopeptide repeat protein [Spirochaetes bacterium]|nr:tetratricopeptide repeat protein [Spirochaetota bacterium]